jgi:hypothetical protein
MNKYTFTKTFTFYDEDILNVICSAVYDIGYWSCIDNDTDVWNKTSDAMDDGHTFEDVFFEILKNGQSVHLIDVEDDEEVWELTLEKLLHGMQMAIDNGDWDGDVDELDGAIGDVIFQYALFDEVVFG